MKNSWLKKRVEKSARDLAVEIRRISRSCSGRSHDSRNFERKTIVLFKYLDDWIYTGKLVKGQLDPWKTQSRF